jgi:PRD1 phage membrane DNA delivery
MDETIRAVVTIATAIIGLAVLSVLVSSRANTVGVIAASGRAFGGSLLAAEAPVLGSASSYGGYGAPFNETVPLY